MRTFPRFRRLTSKPLTGRNQAGFSTWLFAIARNGCLDLMRSRKRKTTEKLEDQEHLPAPDLGDPVRRLRIRTLMEEALEAGASRSGIHAPGHGIDPRRGGPQQPGPRRGHPPANGEGTRIKGEGFHVGYLLKRGERILPARSGDRFAPGDRLQAASDTLAVQTWLRGAGDVSGDRRVTLMEAYQYAFLALPPGSYRVFRKDGRKTTQVKVRLKDKDEGYAVYDPTALCLQNPEEPCEVQSRVPDPASGRAFLSLGALPP